MKFYFAYEQTWTGKWQPVVYHGEVPSLKSANGQSVPRTEPILVPEDCIWNGEPSFYQLGNLFPPPGRS
ncbi:hypothetical protein [Rhizobium phage RHph_X3_15]|nr:hypothetical protein [Rhizobium phage RHph_X3_15]